MNLLTPDPSPTEASIQLFLSRAACGFPSPASNYLEGRLDLNAHCVAHPAATFYLRAEGESMTG
ncbi:TPA: peptidase, partial [Aeromonas sobria]|nr:peptidase [Aeromonas sobria]HEH9433315.1 peptidase [Aeromonas sobria]